MKEKFLKRQDKAGLLVIAKSLNLKWEKKNHSKLLKLVEGFSYKQLVRSRYPIEKSAKPF